jgi:uncharacterized protein YxeA
MTKINSFKKVLIMVLAICLMILGEMLFSACSASNQNNSSENEQTIDAYTATFYCSEHVSVLVYNSQDYTQVGEQSAIGYSRDKTTNEYSKAEGCQVNFKLVFDEGYDLESITALPTENYNNLKTPTDTGSENTYRVTQMTGDITITISAKAEEEQVTGYLGTFNCDSNVSVLLFSKQEDAINSTNGEATVSSYAKSGDTGEIVADGTGQINFRVVLAEGYKIDNIVVSGTYNKIKNDPEATGDTAYYRITKVYSDLTITITTKAITQ